MNVPFGSDKHRKLVELVRSRRDYSGRHMGGRYDKWREAERTYRTFVDPDEKDDQGKKKYPWSKSVVVPITFATMQTALAFDMTAFTQRTPVVQLDGAGPEDVRAAKVMEQVLHHEWRTKRMLLDLYTWLQDRRKYGFGAMWNAWEEDVNYRTVTEDRTVTLPLLGTQISLGKKTRRDRTVAYQGNVPTVVDPFRFWPDPSVSICDIQKGEFVGRTIRRSYSYMLEQQEPEGPYQNVRSIPRNKNATGKGSDNALGNQSDRDRALGLLDEQYGNGTDTADFQDKGYVDLDEFLIKLVPARYELATSERPEKWWITLANDATIVRADPFGLDHQEYPVSVFEASPDAHASMNPGNPEQLGRLQEVLSWLLNSHIENTRKVLNDALVVNPYLIEWEDLLEPQPGRLIRMKREAYQIPNAMDQAVKQLAVQDVTGTHLRDMQVLIDLTQRVSAAPENMQGVTNMRDRTLGEQTMAFNSASARLKVDVMLAWAAGMVPWTHQRVANIQQLMDEELFLKVVGDFPRALGVDPNHPFLHVTSDEIQGQFTYDIIEGVVRSTESMLQTWKEIMIAVGQQPLLAQSFSLPEIFRYVAQLSGISNIDDFLLSHGAPGQIPPVAPGTTSVLPDEHVAREVEKGNLIPNNGGGNGANPLA